MSSPASREHGSAALPWLLGLAALALLAWLCYEPESEAPALLLQGPTHPPITAPPPSLPAPRTATPPPAALPEATPAFPVFVEPPLPPPSELLVKARNAPGDYRRLIEAGRAYLDVTKAERRGRSRRRRDAYLALRGFARRIEKVAREGDDFLATPDAFRWLVHQGRDFKKPFRSWPLPRATGYRASITPAPVRTVQTSEIGLAWWVPSRAPPAAERRRSRVAVRPPPLPLLLTLHDGAQLVSGPRNVSRWLATRYPGVLGTMLHTGWYGLAPFAPTGKFRTEKGHNVHRDLITALREFWQRTPIDFERIVLDCGEQGFPVAATLPAFLAGIVFRAGWHLDEAQRRQVVNFAPVPVYVVADEFHDGQRLAKDLRDAGHPRVALGRAQGLVRWLPPRRRPWPKTFRWSAESKDHTLAHWVRVEEADWRTAERTLAVEVVDTEEQPNTILIDAKNIHRLTLLLRDDVVDFTRDVRVVVNGKPVHTERASRSSRHWGHVRRELEHLFESPDTQVRSTSNYGWLARGRVRLADVPPWVPPPPPPEPPAPPPPADPQFTAGPPPVEPLPDPGALSPPPSPPPRDGIDGRLLAALFLAACAGWVTWVRRRR